MKITIGIQSGDAYARGYFGPLHSALNKNFRKFLTGKYCKVINEFYMAFRVSGKLVDFESEGPERMRYMSKRNYISIDLVFPESSWKGQDPREVHQLIISGVEECLRLMIERAVKEKEVVDLDGLQRDIKTAIDACRSPESVEYGDLLETYKTVPPKYR